MTTGIFQGRTALVTGGARGIGRAICLQLARDGARVAVNYERNEAAARKTLELIEQEGGRAIAVRADVSREADVETMVARVREELGPVDFLVNNAGIAEHLPHAELTFARWKRL